MLLVLKKIVVFVVGTLVSLVSFVSCGIVMLESAEPDGSGIWVDSNSDAGGKPNPGGGNKPVISEYCYMTTIEYPKGYDWRADLQKGMVKCSLVVYIDGHARMKLAVGDSYNVSSDPDMHRLVDGNLYTDYSTDTETIIKKNGIDLFRWHGRESVKGLEVVENDVYTISQPRSGSGFSFRKNGETIISKKDGHVYEHFENDPDNGLCFSFCEYIPSKTGKLERYYIVKESEIQQIALRDDLTNVWDVAVHRGQPCFVASIKGTNDLLFVDGEELSVLDVPDGASIVNSRIFISHGSVYVESVLSIGFNFKSLIWKDGDKQALCDGFMSVASFVGASGSYAFVLNSVFKKGGGYIIKNGEKYDFPSGYLSVGDKTSAFVNGILHIGLSPVNGGKPLLWQDGQVQEMDFNGFISSVQTVSALP